MQTGPPNDQAVGEGHALSKAYKENNAYLIQGAGEGQFRSRFAEDAVLCRRQELAPLRVAVRDAELHSSAHRRVLSVHMMPRGTRCDACGGSAILHPAAFLRIPDNLPRGWEVSPNLCKADWASHLLCAS